MRCLSCNKRLNNRESTRKYSTDGSFVDLCDHCYSHVADEIAAIDGDGYVADFEEETPGVDGGSWFFGPDYSDEEISEFNPSNIDKDYE